MTSNSSDIFLEQVNSAPRNYANTSGDDIRLAVDDTMERVDHIYHLIAAVPASDRTFENTIRPLDEATNLLIETDGAFCFLAYVADDKSLREVAEESDKKLASFRTELCFR